MIVQSQVSTEPDKGFYHERYLMTNCKDTLESIWKFGKMDQHEPGQ